MTTQPEAIRLADDLNYVARYVDSEHWDTFAKTADDLRRLHLHELALQDWLDKTDWVQETAQVGELGMHRADVLTKRIEKLEASNQELLAALKLVSETDLEGADARAMYLIFEAIKHKARAAINKAERNEK